MKRSPVYTSDLALGLRSGSSDGQGRRPRLTNNFDGQSRVGSCFQFSGTLYSVFTHEAGKDATNQPRGWN